jgi:hypothetical protein
MSDQKPSLVPADKHSIMREVALTFRRVGRQATAEGCGPPEVHHRAYEAARAKYLELDADAPSDRLEASARVSEMIAFAIRVNTRWFWEGPDV